MGSRPRIKVRKAVTRKNFMGGRDGFELGITRQKEMGRTFQNVRDS